LVNVITYTIASPQGTLPRSLSFPSQQTDKPAALVATFARFPLSEIILDTLSQHAAGLGHQVCGKVEALDDGRRVSVDGSPATGLIPVPFPTFRRLKEEWGGNLLVLMDSTQAPEGEAALATAWREAISGLTVEVVELDTSAAAAWPVVRIQDVITDCAAQLLHDGRSQDTVKKYGQVWLPFRDHFQVMPGEWPVIRAWLDEIAQIKDWSSGNKARGQANLARLYTHAVEVMHVLPYSPLKDVGLPEFESAPPNPLTWEEVVRIDALEMILRDCCIWHLQWAHGWRPVSCRALLAGDVREAARRADCFILRTQKRRKGKPTRAKAPILSETLAMILELVEGEDLPDDAGVFRGLGNRYRGQPLGEDGFYNSVYAMYRRAGVKGHIPYDLRDTFANAVVEAAGPGGREVAKRLMGHEGGEAIDLYLLNRLPEELAAYSPLRQLQRQERRGSSTLPRLHQLQTWFCSKSSSVSRTAAEPSVLTIAASNKVRNAGTGVMAPTSLLSMSTYTRSISGFSSCRRS